MSNSLSAVHPELIAEWAEKNLPLTPDNVTFGSNKKVCWKGYARALIEFIVNNYREQYAILQVGTGDETLFLLYGRKDFENMTHRRYEYIKGLNGHSEIALYVDTFEEVDMAYNNAIKNGATSVLEPELEPWGQRTCYIADPEGNLIEIGSWNKVYEQKDL